ncbi:MAG: FCD domain-containing protein [Spirochaetia bacterium]|nr:FCD domain-containing protein [Spirochaetia bacterium]
MPVIKDIPPIKRKKLSDEVTQALEQIIIENKLQAGDMLPSQAELSQKLHVGTRSIREAVRSLESRGMVETRQGKGVFVKHSNLEYFLETLMGSFVFKFPTMKHLLVDLTLTRRMIESQAIFDVAQDPPKGFISRFASIVDQLDQKAEQHDIDAYNLLDVQLHKSIIDATENTIIISLYKYMWDLLVRCFEKTGYVRGSIETSCTDHHLMLEALIMHDGAQAKAVMERHLDLTLMKVKKIAEEYAEDAATL